MREWPIFCTKVAFKTLRETKTETEIQTYWSWISVRLVSLQVLLSGTPKAHSSKNRMILFTHIFLLNLCKMFDQIQFRLIDLTDTNGSISIMWGADSTDRPVLLLLKNSMMGDKAAYLGGYMPTSRSVCLSVYPPCLPQLWGHSVQTACRAVEQWRASLQPLSSLPARRLLLQVCVWRLSETNKNDSGHRDDEKDSGLIDVLHKRTAKAAD